MAHNRALGIALEVKDGKGKKKKGPKAVFKILIKHQKHNIGKKAKAPMKRNLNPFTTVLPLKKGVHQAAKVIEKMTLFRKDLHKDALRRIVALQKLSVHKTAIKKVEKKPEEKKAK